MDLENILFSYCDCHREALDDPTHPPSLNDETPVVAGVVATSRRLTANVQVEAAGIEPASRDISTATSTCVVDEFDFARTAPRWLAAVAAGTLAMIGASAGFAWLLAQWAGLHPATVLLGTSPGGIAEMTITAKVLQLGVPAVTAFHVTRYVAVLTLTAPLYRWERGREKAGTS